jgi:tetratricopeptide (TPR) repeat protein
MTADPTLTVIEAALASGEAEYARQAAEQLLEARPGHLAASVALARTLLALGQPAVAEAQLQRVLQADPEDGSAWTILLQLREQRGQHSAAWNAAAAALAVNPYDPALRERLAALQPHTGAVPDWLEALVAARLALEAGRFSEARNVAFGGPVEVVDPIPALIVLEAHWRLGDLASARRLGEQLLAVHGRLVKPRLVLAECLFNAGASERAVALLHEASGLDPGGQVAARLWGQGHRFQSLWPAPEPLAGAAPLPGRVAALLGWNQLGGAPSSAPPAPAPARPPAADDGDGDAETPTARVAKARLLAAGVLRDIRGEINKLTKTPRPKQRTSLAHVVITSRERLVAKYGLSGFARIDQLLRELEAATVAARPDLNPGVIYVDQADSLQEFGLSPVDPQHPWAVKGLLADIDNLVRHESRDRSALGSILIIGGDDVIAHHRLPNPAEDADVEVLSDNPYAAEDDNYFVAERAIGRIPDGAGDIEALCSALRSAIAAHQGPALEPAWWQRLWIWLRRRFGQWLPPAGITGEAFGYTASVWRRASLAAFTVVGDARRLRVCPPTTSDDLPGLDLAEATYAYFNVHGVPDGGEWYGQRDPAMPADYPAFPIALRPQDLSSGVPRVVFSEACYGAAVNGRKSDNSLALRFLAGGTLGVVGSTCVAYGGVGAPLLGADLLARLFWLELLGGAAQGEALRRAKLGMAHIMQQRQGALDGEDQKTVISFVLYGDPSVRVSAAQPPRPGQEEKGLWKALAAEPAVVCTKGATLEAVFDAPVDLVAQIKKEVAHYLPGMEGAELRCSKPHSCRGRHDGHNCPAETFGAQGAMPKAAGDNRLVFTLQKTIRSDQRAHARIVRVTASRDGQILKLAMSK